MDTKVMEAPEPLNMEVVKLSISDAEVKKMKDEYLSLAINGIEDKAGLKKVYEARQTVKRTRVSLVKYADELKEKAIAWQRKVNAEKNRVVGELELIEQHLQSEEDKVEAEKERIRQEATKAEEARIQKRIDRLAQYGYAIDLSDLKAISDPEFEKVVESAREEHEKELAAKAEEERLRKEEEERLAAERKELEELRKKQAEAQRIIDEQNERIRKEQEEKEAAIRAEEERQAQERTRVQREKEQAEFEKKRAEELEEARRVAAEQARLQAIEDQRQKKIKEEERIAAASDKVKFQTVIAAIREIKIPEMKSIKHKKLAEEISNQLYGIISRILAETK